MKLAIITSQFNLEVTGGQYEGALQVIAEEGVQTPDEFKAPGAFEMPLLAKTLAKTGKYEGVICLGCVIKGDTAHFEFISLGTAIGIQQASLETGVPIAFGVLTTYTDEQAEVRSRNDVHNKGREAASAVISAARTLKQIRHG